MLAAMYVALRKAFVVIAMALPLSQASCSGSRDNLTVAMVRAPPPNWPLPILNFDWTGTVLNISQTIDMGIELIQEAADNGADVITFPELWFPGFPKGRNDEWSRNYLPDYVANSIRVGDEHWNRLVAGVAAAGIYANINYAEKTDDYLFMAQAMIGPSGTVLSRRHKLRPSGDERDVFTDGKIEEITTVKTPFGRVGMLECGEHWYPSMTFTLQAQRENWHLGPFPYMLDPSNTEAAWWEGAFANIGVLGHYAHLAGAYSFTAAVGASFVVDPLAQLEGFVSHSVDFDEQPIFYHSVNSTGWSAGKGYDENSQTSWGVLQQIVKGFPDYIPRVEGNLVPWHSIDIDVLSSGSYNISNPEGT